MPVGFRFTTSITKTGIWGRSRFLVSRFADLSPIPLLRLCSLRTGGREAPQGPARCSPTIWFPEKRSGGAITQLGSTTSPSRRMAGRSTWPSGRHRAALRGRSSTRASGRITGSIQGGSGPHETIIGPDGKYVYLGGVNTPYLEIGSTSTGRIVRKLGPLYGPGVRPFTINATQTLAFTTSWNFLGFQVSSINTGKVLYSVSPPGFRFDASAFGSIPDHGISLSPDGRQLYLIDTPNGYVHVFDVGGLPRACPP